MKRFAFAIIGSLLSGIYWWIVFTIVHADILFAGDRNPARPPLPDQQVLLRNGAILLAGILIYALLSLLWRRGAARLHPA